MEENKNQDDVQMLQENLTETETQAKKSKKPVIIGVVAAAAIAAGAFAAVQMNTKDPKTVVVDAFSKVYAGDQKYPVNEIFGFKEMYQSARTTNMEGGMKLQLDSVTNADMKSIEGAGFILDERFDVANRKIDMNLGIQYGGMDLATGKLYMDNDKIMGEVPDLSSKLFVMDYRNEISADSTFGKMMAKQGVSMNLASYMDYIWSFYDTKSGQKFDILAMWDRYKTGSKAIDDFKAQMTAEKTKEKSNFTIDGQEVSCTVYDVTLTKDACVKFAEDTQDFFLNDETFKQDCLENITQMYSLVQVEGTSMKEIYGQDTPEEFQSDMWKKAEDRMDTLISQIKEKLGDTITMKVYVDKKGRLAAFDAGSTWTEDASVRNVNVHTEVKGGAYPTQNADVLLTVSDDASKELGNVKVTKQGTYDDKALTCDLFLELTNAGDGTTVGSGYTGSYYMDGGDYHMEFFGNANGQSGSLSITGTIENLVKGKSLTINMDEISVKYKDEVLGTASGNYYLRPLEGTIDEPTGDQFDMMTAAESDWEAVSSEISSNAMSLMFKLIGLAQ